MFGLSTRRKMVIAGCVLIAVAAGLACIDQPRVSAAMGPSVQFQSTPARQVNIGVNLIGLAPAYDPETESFQEMPLTQALSSIEYVHDLRGYSIVISPGLNQPGWSYAQGGPVHDMKPFKGYWVSMENGPDTLYGFSTTPISN